MNARPNACRSAGFSLIELLIVVAVIGIITAVAIPNLIAAVQRSRQSRTMADVRLISEGLELYQNDHSQYPLVDDGTAVGLVEHLEIYIRSFNTIDGWGEAIRYDSDGGAYTVLSHGANRSPDAPYTYGPTSSFDADIVFAAGTFLQWPEGVQND
jgi:general secretion pathway protein G